MKLKILYLKLYLAFANAAYTGIPSSIKLLSCNTSKAVNYMIKHYCQIKRQEIYNLNDIFGIYYS